MADVEHHGVLLSDLDISIDQVWHIGEVKPQSVLDLKPRLDGVVGWVTLLIQDILPWMLCVLQKISDWLC